jgi:hypothetical protein
VAESHAKVPRRDCQEIAPPYGRNVGVDCAVLASLVLALVEALFWAVVEGVFEAMLSLLRNRGRSKDPAVPRAAQRLPAENALRAVESEACRWPPPYGPKHIKFASSL